MSDDRLVEPSGMNAEQLSALRDERARETVARCWDGSAFYRGPTGGRRRRAGRHRNGRRPRATARPARQGRRARSCRSAPAASSAIPSASTSARPLDDVVAVASTSGTTGTPTFYAFTRATSRRPTSCGAARSASPASARATPSSTASASACSSPASPSCGRSSAWVRGRCRSVPRPAPSGCCGWRSSSGPGRSRARRPTPSTSPSRRRSCSAGRRPSSGSRSSSARASPARACPRCGPGCSAPSARRCTTCSGGAHGVMCCSCDAEPYQGMHVLGQDCAITTQLVDQETRAPIPLVGGRDRRACQDEPALGGAAAAAGLGRRRLPGAHGSVLVRRPGPPRPRPRPHRRPADRQGRQDLPRRRQERRPGAAAAHDGDLPDRARRTAAAGRAAAADHGRARRGSRRGGWRRRSRRSSRRSSTSG